MSAGAAAATGRPVIAIDGPAGSGKSTVSRALAERLGIDRLDTGAMYRAVAWAALQRHLDPGDREAVADLARGLSVSVGERVEADGTDITEDIRGPEVSGAVSAAPGWRRLSQKNAPSSPTTTSKHSQPIE